MNARIRTPGQLIQKFNALASHIGIPVYCRQRMINPLLFVSGINAIDMVAFGEWIDKTYPEYRNKSMRNFLTDRDREQLSEWLDVLGLSEV